jgi:hypothetical protein
MFVLDDRSCCTTVRDAFVAAIEGRYAALNLTPREQKECTISALNDLLGGLAKQRPV